ncbi:MAG: helix-turn-helix transcriptional regulator [Nocardioides sp.]
MKGRNLLESARTVRGLTQGAAARLAGTSQPTLSAYERGVRSPTLAVAERILHALGYDLDLTPHITFRTEHDHEGRTFLVPNQLWRLDPRWCFRAVPARMTGGPTSLYLENRDDRVAAYVWLILHGDETQLANHLDGALLIDAWRDIAGHLPEPIREAWGDLVNSTVDGWFIDSFRADWKAGRPKPVSKAARKRAIQRLADHGLSADEIRAVLKRRR